MRRYSHRGLADSVLDEWSLPRYWDWSQQVRVGSVGVDPGNAKQIALNALASGGNQDDCERILADCVRAVSQVDAKVGADCMSVVLSGHGDVRVRLLPDPTNDSGQAAYTPWVLGPGVMAQPLVLRGTLPHLQAGPFQVEFDRLPPLAQSQPFTALSQPRKPSP